MLSSHGVFGLSLFHCPGVVLIDYLFPQRVSVFVLSVQSRQTFIFKLLQKCSVNPAFSTPYSLIFVSVQETLKTGLNPQRFISYVQRTDEWMSSNRLKMKADRTQLLWPGTRQQLDKLSVTGLQPLSATSQV